MSGAEGVIHINVAEFREAGAKFRDLCWIGLHRIAVGVLGLAFFLDVETHVFEEDDFARLEGSAGGLDFRSDAVVEKLHRLAEQFLELRGDGLSVYFGVFAPFGRPR